jgi:hypothetical protein
MTVRLSRLISSLRIGRNAVDRGATPIGHCALWTESRALLGRAELRTLIGTSPFHAYPEEDPHRVAGAIALAPYGPAKVRMRPQALRFRRGPSATKRGCHFGERPGK